MRFIAATFALGTGRVFRPSLSASLYPLLPLPRLDAMLQGGPDSSSVKSDPYFNQWEDLDDSSIGWHITEVNMTRPSHLFLSLYFISCPTCENRESEARRQSQQ